MYKLMDMKKKTYIISTTAQEDKIISGLKIWINLLTEMLRERNINIYVRKL